MAAISLTDAVYYLPRLGIRGAFTTFAMAMGFVGFFILLQAYLGPRRLGRYLAAVALGVGWFTWLNLLASAVGFGGDRVWARESLYSSWYDADRTRWQSALISGGTLSGMGRFALPLLLWFLWQARRGSWLGKLAFGSAAVGVLVVLVRAEMRNAAIPLLGMGLWVIAWRPMARACVSFAFCGYAVAAPFLWTYQPFVQLLQDLTPEFVIRALGNQNFEDMLTLTGRTSIWEDGMKYLAEGSLLFAGTGQSGLNSADYSASAYEALSRFDPEMVPRLDFHQGFIDLCFIVGIVPACIVVLLLGLAVLKSFRAERSYSRAGTENALALFALAMVALSNAHDGYLSGTSIFLVVAGSTAVWIANYRSAAGISVRPLAYPVRASVPSPQL